MKKHHRKLSDQEELELLAVVQKKGNISQVCREFGITRSTYYRIKKKHEMIREQGFQEISTNKNQKFFDRVKKMVMQNPFLSPEKIYEKLKKEQEKKQREEVKKRLDKNQEVCLLEITEGQSTMEQAKPEARHGIELGEHIFSKKTIRNYLTEQKLIDKKDKIQQILKTFSLKRMNPKQIQFITKHYPNYYVIILQELVYLIMELYKLYKLTIKIEHKKKEIMSFFKNLKENVTTELDLLKKNERKKWPPSEGSELAKKQRKIINNLYSKHWDQFIKNIKKKNNIDLIKHTIFEGSAVAEIKLLIRFTKNLDKNIFRLYRTHNKTEKIDNNFLFKKLYPGEFDL